MNGYKIISEQCRKAGQERKAELYDFLGSCTIDDICALFDSAAFNDIAKGYLRRALFELQGEGSITSKQADAIRKRYSYQFDEATAKDVIG